MTAAPHQVPPLLIQRVRLLPAADRVGWSPREIDGAFRFDYMGAAEFENGALWRALADLRAVRDLACEPVRHTAGGSHEAWFVGAPGRLCAAATLFADQLGPRTARLKEATAIACAYGRCDRIGCFPHRADCRERAHPFDAWWCVDPGAAWVLCRTRESADLWVSAVGNRRR